MINPAAQALAIEIINAFNVKGVEDNDYDKLAQIIEGYMPDWVDASAEVPEPGRQVYFVWEGVVYYGKYNTFPDLHFVSDTSSMRYWHGKDYQHTKVTHWMYARVPISPIPHNPDRYKPRPLHEAFPNGL